jgi:hypothetical protein
MGFVGHCFTWSNRRGGSRLVSERLDRCVENVEWQEMFLDFSVKHLDYCKSDHRPMLLEFQVEDKRHRGANRFHFELC